MERRLGVRGRTLAERAGKARRKLSARLVQHAEYLTQTDSLIANPKLAPQVDERRVERAFEDLTDFLEGYDRADRRKGAVIGWLGSQAFNLLIVSGLMITFMVWRGLL